MNFKESRQIFDRGVATSSKKSNRSARFVSFVQGGVFARLSIIVGNEIRPLVVNLLSFVPFLCPQFNSFNMITCWIIVHNFERATFNLFISLMDIRFFIYNDEPVALVLLSHDEVTVRIKQVILSPGVESRSLF